MKSKSIQTWMQPLACGSSSLSTHWSTLQAQVNLLCNRLVKFFTEPKEPVIRQVCDRHTNQLMWDVYDPATGQVERFYREIDVCIWLEKLPFR